MVSIIVPVFNAERFLYASIKSLQKQSFKDIEIILVNDASTDKSLLICESIAKSDARIIIVNKLKNERALKARASGLKYASGNFILFFDADDYMPCNAVENLLVGQQRNDADITLGAMVNYYDRFRLIKTKRRNLANGQTISSDYNEAEIHTNFSHAFFGLHSIPVTSPAKLSKKDLFVSFNQLDHPVLHAFDDTYLNLIVFNEAKKISFVTDVVYYYRYGGYTSQLDSGLLWQLNKVHELRKKILAKKPSHKAYVYALLEAKNTIYAYFINSLSLANLSFGEFEIRVGELKKMEMYSDLKDFFQHRNFEEQQFFTSVFTDDHDSAYRMLEEQSKKGRIKRRIKRYLGTILRAL